jgi:two-component system, chemotaxis family, CheB/CheR fusion protein
MQASRPLPATATRPASGRHPITSRGPPGGSGDFLVVAIGASAGGLEACSKLMDVLPPDTGMAFILVQHLDPTHESMMVGLLAAHTKMTVLQAIDGMQLAPDHLFIIPPGTYLAVADGRLGLSTPPVRHGARLPFDFLLRSLAEDCGGRAACVVLSGAGADGSLGLRSVKEKGGVIIAQDPDEAGFAGMPSSAIQTGDVDLILRVADIPQALSRFDRRMAQVRSKAATVAGERAPDWLAGIIELLRTRTVHDFSLYKTGTLQRRIERRMAMASVDTDGIGGYLTMLQNDSGELDLLAKDLLINVTSFFRDPGVFDRLAETVIPDLVRNRIADQPLRIWIAGCSTGEETYSLVMLFREEIAKQKVQVKLQFFASDVDPDAVASAREGLYPATIEADVSAERLARFFMKDEHGYTVVPELRGAVVFTVQDLLADPPFSRLDLVSCRNLLIYLRAEAQAKVISLFHFALRPGGILLLGSAETAGNIEGRFEVVSKPSRIYRQIGRSRPGEFGFLMGDGARGRAPMASGRLAAQQVDPAELGRRMLIEAYAPAAILIDHRHECLFLFGSTDRYLRAASGRPTNDILDMIRPDMRTKLRSAIQRAIQEKALVVVDASRMVRDGHALSFSIEVRPFVSQSDDMLLVCFIDAPKAMQPASQADAGAAPPRVVELERELEATRTELQGAVHDLEQSSEEQKAINEEALSVNEEYQSTNEELLTSKEELQSLNEELTALNSQLQETLERQRTTSDDLQNVLFSTDVATLFLDADLKIRFFTPATKTLFAVIPGDVGRPLADLHSFASDAELPTDARMVLQTHTPIEREIEAPNKLWFRRRVLPYRAHDSRVEGVVITFIDITKRRTISDALEAAKLQAEQASMAKSRFLAAASHDLRQPLQTLSLLQGLLARTVEGDREKKLLVRLEETLGAMAGMLNALLDINQIEAGMVRPEVVSFRVDDLLGRLRDEFSYHAQAKGLALRVVPCGVLIRSDPRLLEQMIRNLVSNALKYTTRGKVLIGCRRRGAALSIQIWDSGIGIPAVELQAIFEEYHQLGNAARERSLGLGLGLSIVQRLANLLGHRVQVRSNHGKGSVFTIEVKRAVDESAPRIVPAQPDAAGNGSVAKLRTGKILVVEDDPELRSLLELFLKDAGHRPITAPDGPAALHMIAQRALKPDLVLVDYNLPGGLNGLQLAGRLREKVGLTIPIIILTGDISTDTLRDVTQQNCLLMNKPVKMEELSRTIERLLPAALSPAPRPVRAAASDAGPSTVFIVDDDEDVRETICAVIEADGATAMGFPTGEAFMDAYRPGHGDCLLIDAYLPGMSGIELLRRLHQAGHTLPAIMITGSSDVAMAVQAMREGAADFIEKPVAAAELLASIRRALELSLDSDKVVARREAAVQHLADLTARQRQIMHLVLAGHPSKNIAADLDISQRTVENHRAAIMKKTGSTSLPALARLALAAAWTGDGETAANA